MATVPVAMLVVLLGIAVMAVTVSEAKLKKRSVELPLDANLKSADTMMIRRVALPDREPELFRTKRFKRDLHVPALQRVKRIKRTVKEQLKGTIQLEKYIDDTNLPELSRQKRFKREVSSKMLISRDMLRVKRAGKSKKLTSLMEPYNLPTITRSKRGGLTKDMDFKKHAHSHVHLREKRRQPVETPLNKMGDMVKKAVEKLKRSKRRPKHNAKVHRAKRGSSKDKRSDVLKDITRDITRLQRLRRGIAHEVIRDSKRQTKAKNHNIVKRNESLKNLRSPIKKHHN